MSSPAVFTGYKLNIKRKEELVAISSALDLPVEGNRETILKNLKVHLAEHKDTLVLDPRFTMLYSDATRRRAGKADDDDEEQEEEGTTPAPAAEPEEVDLPIAKAKSPRTTRRSLRDLINRSEEVEAAQALTRPGEIVVARGDSTAIARRKSAAVVRRLSMSLPQVEEKTIQFREVVRDFLSDEQVIASLTVLVECLWFVSTILPVTYHTITVPAALNFKTAPPSSDILQDALNDALPPPSTVTFPLPHPTLATFTSIFLWALPTLLLPALAGAFVSFSKPKKNLDPLTAAIVRLAAVWAAGDAGGVPVQVRIAGAAVSLAFAFANAIYESPSSSAIA